MPRISRRSALFRAMRPFHQRQLLLSRLRQARQPRPPRSAINRITGRLTQAWSWKRSPQASGVTSRYSCSDSSATKRRRLRSEARASGSAPWSNSSAQPQAAKRRDPRGADRAPPAQADRDRAGRERISSPCAQCISPTPARPAPTRPDGGPHPARPLQSP